MDNHLLITGATGFFGRALLRKLISTDYLGFRGVTALTRNPSRFKIAYSCLCQDKRLELVKSDVTQRASLPWNSHFTHVIHCATESTNGPSLDPLTRYRHSYDGCLNILDLAVATKAIRFLLTSSGGIYGPQPATLEQIPETWAGAPDLSNPQTAYSQAKRACEHLCSLYSHSSDLQIVIARCFAFSGIDLPLSAHFALGNFVRDALYHSSIIVRGDGSQIRSYLDQDDLATWLLTLLLRGDSQNAYNVGSDKAITLCELAHLVRDLIAPSKDVILKGERMPSGSRDCYVPCISKISEKYNMTISVSLRDSILKMAEFNLSASS